MSNQSIFLDLLRTVESWAPPGHGLALQACMRLEHRSVNGTIEGLRVLTRLDRALALSVPPESRQRSASASPSVLAAISLGSVYAGLEPRGPMTSWRAIANAAAAVTLLSTPINTAINIDEHATPPRSATISITCPGGPHLELAPSLRVPKGTFTIVCVGQGPMDPMGEVLVITSE